MSNNDNNKTYFITGGGTGGHIYPAVAVADFLHSEGNNIYYVGNPKNLEFDIVKNYPFLPVNISGMPRKISLDLVKWGFQLLFSICTSIRYIKKYKPDLVFGTGGYVSAPSLIAAKFLGVPFVMHDCDAIPGLVTRKLAPFATGVSLAFENAKQHIKNKNCQINGNPIRQEFATLSKTDAKNQLGLEDKLTICIMGGSQGAKSINDAAIGVLKSLTDDYNVQIIFQTGRRNYDDVKAKLLIEYPDFENNKNLIVAPYFDDMVTVLRASDIAVSRAGSLSISELCASEIATIFVPYPHAAADHQRKNARVMENAKAGLYIEDSEINSEILFKKLTNLIKDSDLLNSMQISSRNLAKYDGVIEITKQIKRVLWKKVLLLQN